MPQCVEVTQVQIRRRILLELQSKIEENHRLKKLRPTAAAVTENGEGDILVVQSTKSLRWGFPKGEINPGESAIAGLLRELLEETGVIASMVRRLCHTARFDVDGFQRNGFTEGQLCAYFHCRCRGVPRITLQEDEVCDYRWLSPRKAIGFFERKGRARPHKRDAMIYVLRSILEQ